MRTNDLAKATEGQKECDDRMGREGERDSNPTGFSDIEQSPSEANEPILQTRLRAVLTPPRVVPRATCIGVAEVPPGPVDVYVMPPTEPTLG